MSALSEPVAPVAASLALEPGVTLLEASAGTGKTWSLASLFVRLVAELGLTVDQILVVTYTNAAAAELRDRVRGRVSEALAALERVRAGEVPELDPVLARLASGDVESGIDRLRLARSDFDAAAISTIHGFCERVLRRNAFESRAGFDLEIASDPSPILEEIVDDFLTATLHGATSDGAVRFLVEEAKLDRKALLGLARSVTGAAGVEVEPPLGPDFDRALAAFREAARDLALRLSGEEGADLCAAIDGGPYKTGQRTYKPETTETCLGELFERLRGDVLPFRRPADRKSDPFNYFSRPQLTEYLLVDVPGDLPERLSALFDLGGAARDAPRRLFVEHVRAELPRRLSLRRRRSFDDLLRAVAGGVAESPALLQALRSRFRAALVDEFQDTDPVQWSLFRTVFAGDAAGTHHLYVIGDPKQAIYAFRGADVFVYGEAATAAAPERRLSMDVNQRSDGRLVHGLNSLLGGRPGVFDLDFVGYHDVRWATPRNPWEAKPFLDARPPVRFRWFDARAGGGDPLGTLSKGQAQRLVPRLVADDVVELLASGAGYRARDIAVLVRKNKEARAVHAALLARGVPAVLARAGSVLRSDEATSLRRWLHALDRPGDEAPARALAVTPLFAWTAAELAADLAAAGDEAGARWGAWTARIDRWRLDLAARGFAAAFEGLLAEDDVRRNLLALPDAERRLTNLRHLGELCHEVATREHLGPAAIAHWLVARRDDPEEEAEVHELRLESDADVVQVVTLHKAKGLEYPVVFLPYAWDGALLHKNDRDVVRFHAPDGAGRFERRLDVRLDGASPEKRAHLATAEEEALQEGLRLVYVGLTRAKHHLVVYWGPNEHDLTTAPLGVVLHGGHPGEAADEPRRVARARSRIRAALKEDAGRLLADLEAIASASAPAGEPPSIGVSVVEPLGPGRLWSGPVPDPAALSARTFPRVAFDRMWRRWSYSLLAAGAHGEPTAGAAGTVLAPEVVPAAPIVDDGQDHDAVDLELSDEAADPADDPARAAFEAPPEPPPEPDVALAAFPRGTEAGKYVHKVLELLDFRTLAEKGGRRRPLAELAAALGRRMGVADPAHHALLAEHLPRVLETPLGGAAGGIRLADLGPEDRKDELAFDLPLAGGDLWRPGDPAIPGRRLAEVLRLRTPDETVPASWLEGLPALRLPSLAGFLTGSVDLVYRVRDAAGGERYFVADYKTNRLGPPRLPGEPAGPSRPGHYAKPWMRLEMERHHYFLQYHLYLTALHRHLRARLGSAYDYDRHVGGAVYLFVRGMTGADTPSSEGGVQGVFVDRPPRDVIEGLSALFEGDVR